MNTTTHQTRHPLVTDEYAKEAIGHLPLGCMAYVQNGHMVAALSHFARALEVGGELVHLYVEDGDKYRPADEVWNPRVRAWRLKSSVTIGQVRQKEESPVRRRCILPSRAEVEQAKKDAKHFEECLHAAYRRAEAAEFREAEQMSRADKLQSELAAKMAELAASQGLSWSGVKQEPWTPKFAVGQLVNGTCGPHAGVRLKIESIDLAKRQYKLEQHEGAWMESELTTADEKPEPADPYAELKAAHAAGKVIQHYVDGSWRDWYGVGGDPLWMHPAKDMRIKPEPAPSSILSQLPQTSDIPSEEECYEIWCDDGGGSTNSAVSAVRTALVNAYEAKLADLTRRLEAVTARESAISDARLEAFKRITNEKIGTAEQRAERLKAERDEARAQINGAYNRLLKITCEEALASDGTLFCMVSHADLLTQRLKAELQQKTQELVNMASENSGLETELAFAKSHRSENATVGMANLKDALKFQKECDSLRAELQRLTAEVEKLGWRPTSTLPTEKDADERGYVIITIVDDEGTRKCGLAHWDSLGFKNPAVRNCVWSHWRPTNLPAPQTETDRERFEKWAISSPVKLSIERLGSNTYYHVATEAAWDAWQAARNNGGTEV